MILMQNRNSLIHQSINASPICLKKGKDLLKKRTIREYGYKLFNRRIIGKLSTPVTQCQQIVINEFRFVDPP